MYALRFLNSRRLRRMNAERIGVFTLLMCEQWTGGPIPDDDMQLQFLTRAEPTLARGVLEECFTLTDAGWINPELQQIRAEQEGKHQFFVEAGRKGGKAKAANRPSPPLAIEESRREKSKRRREKDKRKNPPKAPPYENEFLVFWEVYPKKIGKLDALAQYQARRRQGITEKQILEGLTLYLAWAKATDTKLKHPGTFLGPKKWWAEPWHIPEASTVKEPRTKKDQPSLDPKFSRPYVPDMELRKPFKADREPKGNIGGDVDTIMGGTS